MKTTRKFLSLACAVVATGAASGAKADVTFGQPVNLGPVMNSSRSEYNARSSANGLGMCGPETNPT